VPVIHRPSFERSVAEGLHHTDVWFARCLLAMCAVAARHESGDAILAQESRAAGKGGKKAREGRGEEEEARREAEMKAGHCWFSQIRVFKETFVAPPGLHELQMYWVSSTCLLETLWLFFFLGHTLTTRLFDRQLATLYLHGTSTPEKVWYLVGVAIRGAQDAGFHRQDRTLDQPTVLTESKKRIWWVLFMADLVGSVSLGRPRCIRTEE
jgi:Fungal specific transcription factor domain